MSMTDHLNSYLILFNIAKKQNLGNLIRTANALGAAEVWVVGRKQFREFGSFGTSRSNQLRHFYSLGEACEHARQLKCDICGVEIHAESQQVQSHPFRRSTAFMVGNEGVGLSPQQLQACDYFVQIPQYGRGASLNVNVAAGIVLHHFAVWAQFVSNPSHDGKFFPSE
jgi:tRNA G18 (ribose-2'-O)-methylase SpoU